MRNIETESMRSCLLMLGSWELIDRRHRELSEEINKIADTYHQWRIKMVSMRISRFLQIRHLRKSRNMSMFNPGRYVGGEEQKTTVSFEENGDMTSELAVICQVPPVGRKIKKLGDWYEF